uniref:Uncharacterized protein n=1 Tax=Ananas comosus var. bracteatus TaxID=296719 RepID=A0A6V7QGY4_ANACO|nr:unnamed protein product [Ananas comosus var. bracteatus]
MGGGRRPPHHLLPSGTAVVDATDNSSSSTDPASSGDDSHFQFVQNRSSASSASLRQSETYPAVLDTYAASAAAARGRSIQDAKDLIRRYRPGDWIEEVGGTKASDYEIPETTTLLLIGPRGSGKSTLVNRITRVFDDDLSAPVRAQVCHNASAVPGTCFLQEYMIPRNSKSLCVYDTRGLSTIPSENLKLLQQWMTRGVRHGGMDFWDSDDVATKQNIKIMARHGGFLHCQKRTVNFVIFVVDGVSILNSIDSEDTQYINLVVENFKYPFLSFKDSKPVVVVTHGDRLSTFERARVRVQLGEVLGIPPTSQIFDIPGVNDYDTELTILDMLRYCAEHADRNLPSKQNFLKEYWGSEISIKTIYRYLGLDGVLDVGICICVMIVLLRCLDMIVNW